LIHGAFDLTEFEFSPRPHNRGEVFVVGRMARPDTDKWSSNTWPIYSAIQYANKRALMLGMDQRTHEKLGAPPLFADCLKPMAITVHQFLSTLHCLLPINGGARENWPRAGLEAMAMGVPVVAQNDWGWREMIEHGVTGFLGSDDCELAHFAAMLAHDEELRLQIARNARHRIETELADPQTLWTKWQTLFRSLWLRESAHSSWPSLVEYEEEPVGAGGEMNQ
jgi:glycosyltransferase involved in cell wall biosynthesis